MAGIFHTLNIGSESLFANRQGVDTTAHNIANAQTEGYSRQRVKLSSRDPHSRYNLTIGNGVFVDGIWRSHNQFVEKQLGQAVAKQGASEAKQSAIQDLELIFSPELSASIADEITGFFAAMQDLSAAPDDLTARNVVIQQGQNVSAAFKKVQGELTWIQDSLNETVKEEASLVTSKLSTIAELNVKIRALENENLGTANDFRDKRDLAIRELAGKIDLHTYEDRHGMVVVRGPGDQLLVEGAHAAKFQVRRDAETSNYGLFATDFEGNHAWELGSKLTGGSMQGIIDVRDRVIGTLKRENNTLARTFVDEVNSVHRQGFGIGAFSENRGRDFFRPMSQSEEAAAEISVSTSILNNTDAIGASSTINTPGDNVVANALISLKHKKMLSGGEASFVDFYANMAGDLGIEAVRANNIAEADKLLVADLTSRREAVSGVSLDEEAANMIKWQTAFTASSKVITTADEMLETVLGLKR